MRSSLIVIFLCASINVGAQSLFIGPKVAYLIAVSTSDEVASAGAPEKYLFGVDAMIPLKSTLDLRLGAGYRIENGGFNTDYVAQGSLVIPRRHAMINVDEPVNQPPQIRSTVETSSIELTAGLQFPVVRLDTMGTRITLGLGVLVDRMISSKQVDDYSDVPNYTGQTPIEFSWEEHFGFGGYFGAGMVIPLGSSALSIDLSYAFREPGEVQTVTDPPVNQGIGWLVGSGLRMGASFLFGL